MNYFYHPQPIQPGDTFFMSDEESHHALKVLRTAEGDTINILNGMSQKAIAHVISTANRKLEVRIEEVFSAEASSFSINVCLAMLKKRDRMEWFIEKATECGVDNIIIFQAAHSEKTGISTDRLNKISLEAMKQSGNLVLPKIETGIKFSDLITQPFSGQRFIAHCENTEKKPLSIACTTNQDVMILIGPEGDFSHNEIEAALLAGFIPVSLGTSRLRAETAALASVFSILAKNGIL